MYSRLVKYFPYQLPKVSVTRKQYIHCYITSRTQRLWDRLCKATLSAFLNVSFSMRRPRKSSWGRHFESWQSMDGGQRSWIRSALWVWNITHTLSLRQSQWHLPVMGVCELVHVEESRRQFPYVCSAALWHSMSYSLNSYYMELHIYTVTINQISRNIFILVYLIICSYYNHILIFFFVFFFFLFSVCCTYGP